MPDEVILDVTTIEENVTVETTAGDVVEIQVVAPTGTAATVAVGATTTGAAGTNASVTNSGTTSAAVFNFTIPRGDTGATGATGAAGPNSVTSATTSDGTADLDVASLRVYPSGSITLVSTNSGGFVQLSGQAATDARSIAFPNASGTVALTSDITNAVTSETTSDGTASLDISNLRLSQDVTSGLQTAMTLSGNPTTVGDGQQIIWQWYNGASPVTTAAITTEATGSTSDKLLFKTSAGGSLATSLDLNNSLATFSGVVSSLGATYQTGSTFTYNGASAAAHRTALGVSASGDTVLRSAYTPSHSLLVQQSGTGSPSSLSVGNNTILGRASGGGSDIAALSASDTRTVLGLTTLATTTPAANVATFLETPTSANLAASVTDETGSGSLVFATSPTLTAPTIAVINGGTAANDDITIQGTTNATRTTSYVNLQPSGGNVGIGTNTPTACFHAIAETEQVRIGYDAANYTSITVSNNGGVTRNNTGTFDSQTIGGNQSLYQGFSSSAVFATLGGTIRGDGSQGKFNLLGTGNSSDAPIYVIWNTSDTGTGKNAGLVTKTRMNNRYLKTYQTIGQNDNSFGNAGIIQFTALEYSNNTYTTLVTPTEFIGWNFQYYNGAVYESLLAVRKSGIGIGVVSPNAKAKLQVDSTTQGFLPPRMTTTQRDAITSVPAGLMVYNTSLNKLNVYNGTTWETVTSL